MATSKNKTPDPKAGKRAGSAPRLQGKALQLRKKMLKELMIGLGALGALAAVQYFAADWEESQTADRDKLQGDVQTLATQLGTLHDRLTKSQKAAPVYLQLFKEGAPEILLDRQQAASLLEKLKEQYLFASLKVNISPPEDMKDAKLSNAFVSPQAVHVDLSIEALSDEYVLKFLDALRQQLPGKFKITSFTLTKLTNPTPQILALVLQSGKVGLVRADIKMLWMGFKYKGPPISAPAHASPPAAKEGGT